MPPRLKLSAFPAPFSLNNPNYEKTRTAYEYDAVGNVTNVTYQVSPNLISGYDAVNRMTSMSDGIGTTAISYTPNSYVQTETGPWADDTITYGYANRLRTSMSLQQPTASTWSQSYTYDKGNRLAAVTSPPGAFTYIYDHGLDGNVTSSALIDRVTMPTGVDITNNFDGNGRWTSPVLMNAGSALDSYACTSNVANRVATGTRQGTTHLAYGYDGIGELRGEGASDSGVSRWNEQLTYGYDLTGNLAYRTNNTLIQNFQVGSNNDLTLQTDWGRLTVVGTTTSTATNVAVNGTNAVLYFDTTFAATNMPITNSYTAIAQDTYNRRSTNVVAVNLTNNSVFKYDLNGNLTNDGLRNFVYDDENELVEVLVTNQWMSQFQYDGKMRRRIRKEFTWTNSAWAQTNAVFYVYDGNLVIQERNQNNLPTTTYTRGKDLSGRLEGAGGIGGLLARTDQTLGQTAYYHADGNGNVTMLINSTNSIVAKYLYDAFGNVLSKSGSLCDANLYRFSSKEAHPNSGLVYYLYRFYDPNLQRWPNRDPKDELGFQLLNYKSVKPILPDGGLYLFVFNNPVNKYDALGLGDVPGPGTFLGPGLAGGILEIIKTLSVCSSLKSGEGVYVLTPASALGYLSPIAISAAMGYCHGPFMFATKIYKDSCGVCHYGGPVVICLGSGSNEG